MLSKQFQAAHPVHLQKTNLALVPILDIVLLSVSKNKGQFTSCAPFRLRKPAPEGPEWPEPPWNQGFWQGSWWELSRDFISLQPCLANPFELLFNVLHLQPKHWPVSGAAMEQSWKIWYIWAEWPRLFGQLNHQSSFAVHTYTILFGAYTSAECWVLPVELSPSNCRFISP